MGSRGGEEIEREAGVARDDGVARAVAGGATCALRDRSGGSLARATLRVGNSTHASMNDGQEIRTWK
jgi:hypothetical protein